MKLISIILSVLFVTACATTPNAHTQGSKVELYGVIDSGVGVQRSSQ